MARTEPGVSREGLRAAILLALCLGLPPPAPAASPEAAGLLQRAEYWQGRRDDLARDELGKLFRLEPDHPEGLLLQARIQLRANQEREAAATLERLRKAHPGHPGVAKLAALLRIRGADKDRLRQARQLGRAGRNDEAIKAYRAIFPDGFPDDDLELEHAQLVAGTRNGWEAGRGLLADLARRHPDDPRFQVALASHVSTRIWNVHMGHWSSYKTMFVGAFIKPVSGFNVTGARPRRQTNASVAVS